MRARGALFGSWLTTAVACIGLLLPKCPLCIAAYLCLFGVGGGTARALVGLGVPACLALIVGSLLATAWFFARRGRGSVHSEQPNTCCASRSAGT